MEKLRAWVPVLALTCAAAAAAPAAYTLREGRFSVTPPAGWSTSRDEREDSRQKVYGVQLSGPRSADGVLSTISISYYPPDNALFKGGAAEFLKRNLGTDPRFVMPADETTTPLEKTVVGGLPAQSFTRHTHEYIPPDRTDTKEIPVVEKIEVVSAKAGFYVLEFKSSEKLGAKLKSAYAKARSSLRFSSAP